MLADPLSFPAAIVATIIAILVVKWGNSMHRAELSAGDGKEPKGYNRFLLVTIGGGALLYFTSGSSPFLYHLSNILIGMLIGGGLVHFALRGLSALRSHQRQ